MEMSSISEYDEAMPRVRKHLEQFERALKLVRTTHRGRPISEVLGALDKAFEAEGAQVWNDVRAEVARR
ncbi:hypothetical protein GCM10009530_70680 [Microbispora corallina]|uniref:Antitoxin n=1 Tax=Microbispora corallina TaxID=83302 RepID=A0ABQ4GAE5_9ACTN|nr:hypothetical protein Mco01_70630 [Microbispora corallina]